MYIESLETLSGAKKDAWENLLIRCGLTPSRGEQTVLAWEEERLVATGTREGSLFKCIAVDDAYQGQGLTAAVLTQLRNGAFQAGHRHLFLYTKPQNEALFSSLFFYPIARTGKVLLMESEPQGIRKFLAGLEAPAGPCGAIVMNADPFTLGHRYLVESAAGQCDRLILFVLSEDKGRFSAADRMEMVRRGTQDLPNVTVHPTGPYLISSATFPTYFLRERDSAEEVHCMLDIEIFARYFAPHFSIARRFVGTEPLSALTARYNEVLKQQMSGRGVQLTELPRLEKEGIPVSASAVRRALDAKNWDRVRALVPKTTYDYLIRRNCHE